MIALATPTATPARLNREVFARDPLTHELPNQGVAKVGAPTSHGEWANLSFELSSFVCEGHYRTGLDQILASFLRNLGKNDQPSAWVSGFFGSGKSHFVRVLEHLWADTAFPGGDTARNKVRLSDEIADQLRELSNRARSEGGLWAASGLLSSSASQDSGAAGVRVAILGIVLKAAGLPQMVNQARFVLWLHEEGHHDGVVGRLTQEGRALLGEVRRLHVSTPLHRALADVVPDYGSSAEARAAVIAQFGDAQADVSDDEFLELLEATLRLRSGRDGRLPLTLIVLDELQQSLTDDAQRTIHVQQVVESVSRHFGGQVLVVATGQSAMGSNVNLEKLQGRFPVRITLSDADVEEVVRRVVLEKAPAQRTHLTNALEHVRGEISRHLRDTRIGGAESLDQLAADYPLLPTRRRFWEAVLRSVNPDGMSGQLRTQLKIIQEANRAVGDWPLGHVIPSDYLFGELRNNLLQTGVLLREVDQFIAELELREGDAFAIHAGLESAEDRKLPARLARLVFLIQQLPREGLLVTGLRATDATLADLLVVDLSEGAATVRRRVTALLTKMTERGLLEWVEGEYRLQTREGQEWGRAFRAAERRFQDDPSRLEEERRTLLRAEVARVLKGVTVVQGQSRTPRDFAVHFGPAAPETTGDRVPVWVREGGGVTDPVLADARAAGQDSPTVFVSLPRPSASFTRNLVAMLASRETVETRGTDQTDPATVQARAAMQARMEISAGAAQEAVRETVEAATVVRGGGSRPAEAGFRDAVRAAVDAGAARMFHRFAMADNANWETVLKRATEGSPDPLRSIDYAGEPRDQPVCAEVLRFIGTGRKGNAIRDHFERQPWGWPKKTTEAAIVVLVGAGLVQATRNGQPVAARGLTSQQIGQVDFRGEEKVVTAKQLLDLRGLLTRLGVKLRAQTPEETRYQVPLLLQQATQDAAAAGGEAPRPLPPDTALLTDLQARSGNDQLLATWEAIDRLEVDITRWRADRDRIAQRLPAWGRLEQLLRHGTDYDRLTGPRADAAAIRDGRQLLADPDPVPPVLREAATALRAAVTEAYAEARATRDREIAAIADTAEWRELPDDRWERIFRDVGLGPIPEPAVATDEELLRSLERRSLELWRTERQAYPQRVGVARKIAVDVLTPTAVEYAPPRGTIHDADELEAWLDRVRIAVTAHLDAGHPVVV